jgi:hypothetical protein
MEPNSPSLSISSRTRGHGRRIGITDNNKGNKATTKRVATRKSPPTTRREATRKSPPRAKKKLSAVYEQPVEVPVARLKDDEESIVDTEDDEEDDDETKSTTSSFNENIRMTREIIKENEERKALKKQLKTPVSEVHITGDDKNNDKTNTFDEYVNECKDTGTMDTLEDKVEYYKIVTRKHGWKYFKVVTDEDFVYGSNFVRFFCDKLKQDVVKAETRQWWEGIKATVQRCMMDMRSACTQAMKRRFLGKYFKYN